MQDEFSCVFYRGLQAIPELKAESITLSDASLHSGVFAQRLNSDLFIRSSFSFSRLFAAVEFVQSSVKEPLGRDAVEAVAVLGGRYNDLLSLVRSVEEFAIAWN